MYSPSTNKRTHTYMQSWHTVLNTHNPFLVNFNKFPLWNVKVKNTFFVISLKKNVSLLWYLFPIYLRTTEHSIQRMLNNPQSGVVKHNNDNTSKSELPFCSESHSWKRHVVIWLVWEIKVVHKKPACWKCIGIHRLFCWLTSVDYITHIWRSIGLQCKVSLSLGLSPTFLIMVQQTPVGLRNTVGYSLMSHERMQSKNVLNFKTKR